MKRKLFSLLLFIFISLISNESFGQYNFGVAAGTYQRLTNPISLNNGNVWTVDSNFVINYNFPFSIHNQTFNSLQVIGGGAISFSGFTQRLSVFTHTDSGDMLEDQGSGSNSLSPLGYEIVGVPGQQILKIEWENAGFRDWCPPSPANDFVNFQIWLYENGSRLEVHFGNSFSNLNSYGNPNCNTGTQGSQITFTFNGCSTAYSLSGSSSSPSWSKKNHCMWQPSVFINGTPNSGTIYQINPISTFLTEVETKEIKVFPSPVKHYLTVSSLSKVDIKELLLIDSRGKEYRVDYTIEAGNAKVNMESLSTGVYFLKVITNNSNIIIEKVVKS